MEEYKIRDYTRNKFKKPQSTLRRTVKPYKRKLLNKKVSQVKGYEQGYKSPRGPVKSVTPDNMTKRSQTMWLMDKKGHFVGRANYEGNTTAKNISKFGYDDTTVLRDTKRFKRILGRK